MTLTREQFFNQVQFLLNLQPQQIVLIPDARALYSALANRDKDNLNIVTYSVQNKWKVYALYTIHFNQYLFESKERPSLKRAINDVSEAHLALLEKYY